MYYSENALGFSALGVYNLSRNEWADSLCLNSAAKVREYALLCKPFFNYFLILHQLRW